MQLVGERYYLLPEPKQGGMSVIHRALDTKQNGKNVAVKVYSSKPIENDILRESFRRERMALRELKHENIVTIHDEGFFAGEQSFYTVLEWLPNSYSAYLRSNGPVEWHNFYKPIGRPILEAISFAHNRAYVHRDIKPDNIMLNDEGVPKIIDFGTSKLKRYIASGVTLREFSSAPYAPPEVDDGSDAYARDTYSFCVSILDALSGGTLSSREEVLSALNTARLNLNIKEVLTRGLSDQPDDRYHNADALLADLDSAERTRIGVKSHRKECYLSLTPRTASLLGSDTGSASTDAIEKFVMEDLNSACGIKLYESSLQHKSRNSSNQYQIFGSEFSYHVKLDDFTKDRLIVLNAKPQSPYVLERIRESCYNPLLRFRFGMPLNQNVAIANLSELDLLVEGYAIEMENAQSAQGSQRLFDVWKRMLEVKYEYDIQQQDAIRYSRLYFDGKKIYATCDSLLKADHQGQYRALRLFDNSVISMEITEVDLVENELTLVCHNIVPDEAKVPREGSFVVDVGTNKVSLDRQRSALEAVHTGSKDTVRADLKSLISNPETISKISSSEEIFAFQDLDDDKIYAVKKAAHLKDFLLIEGPPGTGKTTVIAEIVLQELKRNPEARILLTSQTNIALDNAIERIERVSIDKTLNLSITRLGRLDDDRIGLEIRKYLLPKRMDAWKEQALLQSEMFLENWAAKRGIDRKNVEVGMLIEQAIFLKRRLREVEEHEKVLAQFSDSSRTAEVIDEEVLGEDIPIDLDSEASNRIVRKDLAEIRDERASVRHRLNSVRADLGRFGSFEADLAEESEESLQDFLALYYGDQGKDGTFKQLLSLTADWKLRFGLGTDFHTALMSTTNIVAGTCIGVVGYRGAHEVTYDLCILDEASKATATEAMVPLSRSRRWILVGDLQQLPPFQDEALRNNDLLKRSDLSPDDLTVTLFSHLLKSVPPEAKVSLLSQRRMVPAIGDLVSSCFYNNTLVTRTEYADDELTSFFGRPVLWMSTSRLARRHHVASNGSIKNESECEQVIKLLKRLSAFADAQSKSYSVCILTPYSAQIAALQRRIIPERVRWNSLSVEVKTVDSYQGKEADVAILSFVRSDPAGNKLGFLRETERLNVAVSRAKLALVMIGDRDFLKYADEPNPFRDVIEYIETTPGDCHMSEVIA